MEPSGVQYATSSDGLSIAYWTMGAGQARPLVFVAGGTTSIGFVASEPSVLRRYEHIASDRMIVAYDRRGAGMSDPPASPDGFGVEQAVADLRAVVERVGLGEFDLWGDWQGARTALEFAKGEPRVKHIVAWHPALLRRSPGWPTRVEAVRAIRGVGDLELWAETFARTFMGRQSPETGALYEREIRSSVQSLELWDQYMAAGRDVSEFSPLGVTCPVLVMRTDHTVWSTEFKERSLAAARDLVKGLEDAQFRLLTDTLSMAHYNDVEPIWSVVRPFLDDGDRPADESPASGLQTILFTDLEASTPLTQRLGDEGAQEILRGHNKVVREALDEHGGREVKHTGDGIMASFPSAVSAVTAALHIQRGLAGGEVRVRVGLNAGEPIAEDDDLFGLSVIKAARIADRAEPGTVLVSDVVKQLCEGKTFEFASLGEVSLKGFDEAVTLFEVRA